jgi:hypothetical protein
MCSDGRGASASVCSVPCHLFHHRMTLSRSHCFCWIGWTSLWPFPFVLPSRGCDDDWGVVLVLGLLLKLVQIVFPINITYSKVLSP